MRFLVDANLPRRTAQAIRTIGFAAQDVREIGLGAASDDKIAECAKAEKMVLLSRDYDFADARNYPPGDYSGIVVLSLPKDAKAEVVLRTLSSFLSQAELVANLPGRLAIVESSRVRFKPA